MDDVDLCVGTAAGATVDANGCSSAQRDTDHDGVKDNIDLCPNTAAGQSVDVNGCSSAQRDTDRDGVKDNVDNCPLVANAGQADSDFDGIGDACDPVFNGTRGKVEGEGRAGGASFEFEAKASGKKVEGELKVTINRRSYRGDVTGLAIDGNVATVVGTVTDSGRSYTFVLKVTDGGKKGPDTFSITWTGVSVSGVVNDGKIKIDA
jgi:hypothetical protein